LKKGDLGRSTLKRVPEPELMDGREQARAYARADFEEPHGRILDLLVEALGGEDIAGCVLDLGCGPGDVTFRVARRFPRASITAVDGAAAMIELANERKAREGEIGKRVTFVRDVLPGAALPRGQYDLILSTSFLHHLHDPAVLWNEVKKYASAGTRIFVADLRRPASEEAARALAERYSGNEPEVLKRDFYHSLLAAFEPGEVEEQLAAAGLRGFRVRAVGDRHLVVTGRLGNSPVA